MSVTGSIPRRLVRVYLIERQSLFGNAVAALLGLDPDISVAGTAVSRNDASIDNGEIDVILVDADDVDDITESVAHFRARCPSAHVCFLSASLEPELMQQSFAAGASGYIVKDASAQELAEAIKTVGGGGRYVDPRVRATPARRPQSDPTPYTVKLSRRETEIIRLIAQGLSNRDIGERLLVSERTVQTHVSRIFSKLQFTTRSQAAIHAVRNGLF
jgi:DNA-binding NarL/FixJ family response regulator